MAPKNASTGTHNRKSARGSPAPKDTTDGPKRANFQATARVMMAWNRPCSLLI